eukprot:145811-Amphidinium_carterae.1
MPLGRNVFLGWFSYELTRVVIGFILRVGTRSKLLIGGRALLLPLFAKPFQISLSMYIAPTTQAAAERLVACLKIRLP